MQRGFTLIELLVVIAIIGILSVAVMTILDSSRVDARKAQSLQNASNLERAALYCEEGLGGADCEGLSTGQCNGSLITNRGSIRNTDTNIIETYAADCGFRPSTGTGYCRSGSGREVTWREAFDFCRDNGGRLCRVEELEVAQGSGCSHDSAYNWTTSSCTTQSDERGVWVAQGSNSNDKSCEPALTEESAYISCCSESE